MSGLEKYAFEPSAVAVPGKYRSVRVLGYKESANGLYVAGGKNWEMMQHNPCDLILNGFALLRKRSILDVLNADQYDARDELFALKGNIPTDFLVPNLDSDKQLFNYFKKSGELVLVYKKNRLDGYIGRVDLVHEKSCRVRPITPDGEISPEAYTFEYGRMRMVLWGTDFLRVLRRRIEGGRTVL
jgi:hypothetical protein